MQYVALKTFRSRKHEQIFDRGTTLTLDDRYAAELMRLGLIKPKLIDRAPLTVAHDAAPATAEKKAEADSQDDGEAKPSSASRPGRRSRRKTPNS
jgi:hypothetical protein